MATFYNEEEERLCNSIISFGKAVSALQEQLELQKIHHSAVQEKIGVYEIITGIKSQSLPELGWLGSTNEIEKQKEIFLLEVFKTQDRVKDEICKRINQGNISEGVE